MPILQQSPFSWGNYNTQGIDAPNLINPFSWVPPSSTPPVLQTRASAAPAPQAAPAPSFDMSALWDQISNMPATTTTTAQQEPSKQLEAMYAAMQANVANLQSGMQQAYQAKQGTYEGLLTSLADLFRTTGSRGAGAAQTSALASGLTPMEAGQQGQNVLLQALQAYAPERANLQAQQSDVGVQLQNALAGVMQGVQLPLAGMMSPYYQGVAGSTQTTEDPMQKAGLLANLASAIQSHQLEQQRLTQQGQQFGQTMGFNQQQLAQRGQQFGQTMGFNQQQLAQRGQQFGQTLGLDQARLAQQAQLSQQGMQASQMLNQMLEQGRTQRSQAGIAGRADLQQAAFDWQRQQQQEANTPDASFISGYQDYNNWMDDFLGLVAPSTVGYAPLDLGEFESTLPSMPTLQELWPY